MVFADGSNNSVVTGITINRFSQVGIVFNSNGNLLDKSFIGLMADGITTDISLRQQTGVKITGSRNRIGGKRNGINRNNLITGNKFEQILITNSQAFENVVVGNDIGLTFDYSVPTLANAIYDGIVIQDGASRNRIGGNTEENVNEIGNFASYGVFISDNSNENSVTANVIFSCNAGVGIVRASNNTIGGAIVSGGVGSRNVIGDNDTGIFVGDEPDPDGLNEPNRKISMRYQMKRATAAKTEITTRAVQTLNNKIHGNVIGLHRDLTDFGNEYGIVVRTAEGTLIGTGDFGFHNFIAGNMFEGVVLEKEAAGNKVQGNFIGYGLQTERRWSKPNRGTALRYTVHTIR